VNVKVATLDNNRVSEQRLDEEQHQQAAGEVQNSRQASRQRQTQCAHWSKRHTIRYDTIEEINVDSKAEYTA